MSFASTGGTIGSAIGGPVGAAIGTGVGAIGDIIFGNNAAAKKKKAADKAAQRAQKYNKRVWRVEKKDLDRSYKIAVENQDIQHRNNEAELKFLEEGRRIDYDYQMGIRDYQFSQQMRAYDESINRANQQKSFNQMAEDQALLEQQRYLQENLVNFAFTESQTMMDFAAATAGLEMKRGQAKAQVGLARQRIDAETTLGIKQARTETQLARQQATIESLKARGQAMAVGQAGRSSRKVAQGIRAEAGAQQASLVEQFLLGEENLLQRQLFNTQDVVQQLLFTEQGIDLNLTQLNGQLELDRLQMKATRDNLNVADVLSRKRIALERQQADIEAESRIRLKPEITPPLPEPLTLPRPEKTKIFKPGKRPEPIKSSTFVPNNQAATIAQAIGDVGSSVIKSGVLDDLFNFGSGGNTATQDPGPFAFPSNEDLGITNPYSLSNV